MGPSSLKSRRRIEEELSRQERNMKDVASWKQSTENVKRQKLTVSDNAESKVRIKRTDLTIGFGKG